MIYFRISQCTFISVKGLVHFQIKMSLFTYPHVIQDVYVFLSSVEKKLRFLINIPQIIIHIVYFDGLKMVKGQNYSFIAASKGYKRYQAMNKGLI